MNTKLAIILNYGMLVQEMKDDMQEKADFISSMFAKEPELLNDPDLIKLSRCFKGVCDSLRDLDVEGARIFDKNFKEV